MKFLLGICSYKDKQLRKLLRRIYSYGFKNELEKVIVVHENSGIKTPKGFIDVKEKTSRGKALCINKIIEISKNFSSDVLVFLAGDVYLDVKNVDLLVDELHDESVVAAYARPVVVNHNFQSRFFGSFFWNLHHKFSLVRPKICGELYAVKKKYLDLLPENVINDDYYIQKLVEDKGEIKYLSNVYVNILFPPLTDFFNQRKRINQGYMQVKKPFLKEYIPILIKAFFSNPVAFTTIFTIELLAKIFAWIDFKKGKIMYNWKRSLIE